MTILLDHCTPRRYSKLLQTWGYNVEELQAHIDADATDAEVLQLAQQLDAVLLTVDMDFANIQRYPPQMYSGIIVMRYQAQTEEVSSSTLKRVLENLYREKLRGCLVVIAEDQYRVRQE